MPNIKYEIEKVKHSQAGDDDLERYEIRYSDKDKDGKKVWVYPVANDFESKKLAQEYIDTNLS